MNEKIISILLTGGGTAGHVWPHFALFEGNNSLAKLFREQKLNVHYIGSYEGMEKDLVQSTQPKWTYHSVSTGKLRRYFSLQNFLDPFKILLGFIQSFILIGRLKPLIIFSKGGFVSVPIVWAAWLRRVPVVIHESDATPSLATKMTLPFAAKGLFAFGETLLKVPFPLKKRSIEIGLPVRESLFSATKEEGLKYFNFNENKKIILIFGGSLGAQSLNAKVYEMLPELLEKYQIIHLTGKGNKKELAPLNYPERYIQIEFLKEDMRYAYATADMAICRAGASSIFELAAARIPMILLPLGLHASRGDQIINARIFAQKGWAQWIDEPTFQKETAIQLIDSTMNSLENRRQVLFQAPSAEAANKIAEILWEIMQP